ncbi:hypothetical protein ACFPK9_12845 [Rubritalea spongiae]|uniref:Uncharacterized protein n=1 Tax=Rubritalea spongiae TaxID=430797 RepID=A0ABW5E145_9BACT
MAATNQIEQQKLILVKQLEESRTTLLGAKLLLDEQLSTKKLKVQETLNFPKRVKSSFELQPLKSSLIAAGSGIIASLFLRHRKKRAKHRRNKLAKMGQAPSHSISKVLALAVLRPVVQRIATNFYHQWLDKREQQQVQELSFQNRRKML